MFVVIFWWLVVYKMFRYRCFVVWVVVVSVEVILRFFYSAEVVIGFVVFAYHIKFGRYVYPDVE